MKHILLFLLLIAPGAAPAGPNPPDELRELEAALDGVEREQQSVYRNYQMTKELRLIEVQEGSPPMMQHPYGMDINTPPPDYDDVVRTQMEREQRIQQHTDEMKSLSSRYLELEHRRKALLEQIRKLKQHPDE